MNVFPPGFESWSVTRQDSYILLMTKVWKAEAEAHKAQAEVRKAEAEAEAHKAQAEVRKAEAEARKAEVEVRKADIEAAARNVGFEYLPIKVTHWDSLVSHYIPMPMKQYSLDMFRVLVRLAFNDDIITDEFHLYLLPFDCEIDQRVLVDGKQFSEYLESIYAANRRLLTMFVWNYEKSSPAKLPNVHVVDKSGSVSSDASWSTNFSGACREAYDSTCLCCGYNGETQNQAAHIFDIGVFNRMKEEGQPFLRELKLVYIDQLANLICLCIPCHTKFDNFRVGIDPTERVWIVSLVERNENADFYNRVHGKKIRFYEGGNPSQEALMWKWRRFVDANKAWCCCFCEGIFPTSSTTEQNFNDHKLDCKLKAMTFLETGDINAAEGTGGGK